jgi:hypothetical protein
MEIKKLITAENMANQRAVQFGISPFGIWEHQQNNSLGSHTPLGSSRTYTDQVYADTYKWIKDELVDYIVPPIYWSFDQGAAPYGELARWWAETVNGKRVDLYIGHANYKHMNNAASESAWMNPEEILNQLKYNQQYPQIKGSVFFSYNDLLFSTGTELRDEALNKSIDLLKAHYKTHQTLVPPKPHLKSTSPGAPLDVRRLRDNEIQWNDTEKNTSKYYVVYRILTSGNRGRISRAIQDPANIAAKVWRDGQTHRFVDTVSNPRRYTYIVTSLDAAHNESEPVIASR